MSLWGVPVASCLSKRLLQDQQVDLTQVPQIIASVLCLGALESLRVPFKSGVCVSMVLHLSHTQVPLGFEA